MPRLTFTTLVAASLAASTMGQHVPEYRLRGSPVPDTATAPPVGLREPTGDMGGDIKLKSSLTGTVRFMGNMTVSDTQSSYYDNFTSSSAGIIRETFASFPHLFPHGLVTLPLVRPRLLFICS